MIEITIPGFKELCLRHLVLDYNGTLALDGALGEGALSLLGELEKKLSIHIVTADTFGSVGRMFAQAPYRVFILPPGDERESKARYVRELGAEGVVCIGNGRNDLLMIKEAALGIAVLQKEGLATETLCAADLVTPGIEEALGLLLHPLRLVASLRC